MNKKTSTISILLLIFILTISASYAAGENQSNKIKLTIDGQEVEVNGFIVEDKPYVSVEELAKHIGYSAEPSEKSALALVAVEEPQSPATKVKLDFTAEVIVNNSVGNDWSYNVQLNGNTYYSQHNGIELDLDGRDLEFTLYAEEYDTTLPDIGTVVLSVPYADVIKGDPLIFVETVTVKEDSGRYKGNIAEIEFTLILKPL